MVFLYLAGIVAANLLAATFGPAITPLVAFLFIGLDLSCRDALHDRWHGQLLPRMTALIVAGSLLSWLLNRNAGPIALASCVAFGAAALTDALIYHALRRQPWLLKVNASNIPAAIADSVIFLWLAFGVGALVLAPLQVLAKVVGGAIWSVILERFALARPDAQETV